MAVKYYAVAVGKKPGRMNDQMAVELFIIRYSAAKQKK